MARRLNAARTRPSRIFRYRGNRDASGMVCTVGHSEKKERKGKKKKERERERENKKKRTSNWKGKVKRSRKDIDGLQHEARFLSKLAARTISPRLFSLTVDLSATEYSTTHFHAVSLAGETS